MPSEKTSIEQLHESGIISAELFDTAEAWSGMVRRHAAIMGYSLPGGVTRENARDESIPSIRRQWSDCYNALMNAARDHGLRVLIVTYGTCIENWPVGALHQDDHEHLRVGLTALSKVEGLMLVET